VFGVVGTLEKQVLATVLGREDLFWFESDRLFYVACGSNKITIGRGFMVRGCFGGLVFLSQQILQQNIDFHTLLANRVVFYFGLPDLHPIRLIESCQSREAFVYALDFIAVPATIFCSLGNEEVIVRSEFLCVWHDYINPHRLWDHL